MKKPIFRERGKLDQLNPENLENQSIEKSQAAGVGIGEIDVRDFAAQNASGRLAEGAVVIGKPAMAQIRGRIGDGKQPDGQEDSDTRLAS